MEILLQKGSKGELVKQLQKYFKITTDGIFGNQTYNKVIEWQKTNNLRSDGIVTTNMWNKIFPQVKIKIPILDKLIGLVPNNVIEELKLTPRIHTPLRLAHFLSQCSHESNGFKIKEENLNYSYDRLLLIFKSDFDKDKNRVLSEEEKKKAKTLVGNPEKIANFVYANQNGNGNEESGDGWKYRGRGYIQITGKSNYMLFDKMVSENILENPVLVATKYPLTSALFFFDKNNLWEICDTGSTKTVITKLTKRINGGTNGLTDRINLFNKFYNILK